MVIANLLGQAASTILLAKHVWRVDGRLIVSSVSPSTLRAGLWRYRKFPLYNTWSALMNAVSVHLPTFALAAFFPPATVGYYALGHRLLSVPASLVGASIAQVFLQRAAVARYSMDLPGLTEGLLGRLVLVSAFPFLALAAVGPELFTVAFGEEWTLAGRYAQVLAPWMLFGFLGTPLYTLLTVLEIQEVGLVFNIVLLITRLGSLGAGAVHGDALLALGLYSASGAVLWAAFCAYVASRAGVKAGGLLNAVKRPAIIALGCVAPLVMIVVWLPLPAPVIAVIAAVCGFGYYFLALGSDRDLRGLVFGAGRSHAGPP